MTNTEAMIYNPLQLRCKELIDVFQTARGALAHTSPKASIMRHKERRLQQYLKTERAPDLDGLRVATLTVEDITIRSIPQIFRKIDFGRIQAVAHLGSNDAIATFLGIKEDRVRRVIQDETDFSPAAKQWWEERTKAWEALRTKRS